MKFPFSRLQVEGASMLPNFFPNQYLISFNWAYFLNRPKKGEVVVIYKNRRLMIKRVQKVGRDEVFVIGDNLSQSTDSRHFGWVKSNQVIGKVIYSYSKER